MGYIDIFKNKTFLPLENIMKNSNKDLINKLKYIKITNFREIVDKLRKQIHLNDKDKENYIKSNNDI